MLLGWSQGSVQEILEYLDMVDVIQVPAGSLLEEVVAADKAKDASFALVGLSTADATAQLERVRSAEDGSLGVERESRRHLREEESRLKALVALGRTIFKLPLEVLGWRNKRGFPRLALFSVDYPSVKIDNQGSVFFHKSGPEESVRLPREIEVLYEDVGQTLGVMRFPRRWRWTAWAAAIAVMTAALFLTKIGELHPAAGWLGGLFASALVWFSILVSVSDRSPRFDLRASYIGVIPPSARTLIKTAKEAFGEVYLLAEVEFDVGQTARPKRDPLVLGWDGDSLWLLGAYDTTPLEELIVRRTRSGFDE